MRDGRRDCRCPKARHQHGTRGAYLRDGCRCFQCRVAHSRILQHAANVNRDGGGHLEYGAAGYGDPGVRSPRCGVARRIEALQAIGYSITELGRELGMTRQAVRDFRLRQSPTVRTVTARKVADAYDRLWDKPPAGRYADRTRRWAAAQGFKPPLCWDDDTINDPDAQPYRMPSRVTQPDDVDEIAVAEAVAGRRVKLTRRERVEASRQLTERGYGAKEIAVRLNTTDRNVQRYRTETAA